MTALYIFISFIASALTSMLLMPWILSLCKRNGYFDRPNDRKVHKNNTPRLGGVVFVPSSIVGIAVTLAIIFNFNGEGEPLKSSTLLIGFGIFAIYVTGLLDDLFGLSAYLKFFFQFIAALCFPLVGLTLNNLYGFCGTYEIPEIVSYPLTVFLVMLVVNSINLIDGIDGLASSLSLISFVVFTWAFWEWGMHIFCLFTAAMSGSLLVFLWYNLFGDNAKGTKIFMGDSGSLMLGYALSYLALKLCSNNEVKAPEEYSLLLSYTLLLIPTFDLIRVACSRILRGEHPFHADKTHLHHKLMRTGHYMRMALLTILSADVIFALLNAGLYFLGVNITWIVLADVIFFVIWQKRIDHSIAKNDERLAMESNLRKELDENAENARKICILTPRFPVPENGGDVLRINNIAHQLRKQGYKLILLSLEEDGQPQIFEAQRIYHKVYTVHRHQLSSLFHAIVCFLQAKPMQCGFYMSGSYRRKLREIIQKENPDLYIAHLLRMMPYLDELGLHSRSIIEMTDALSKTYAMSSQSKGNWLLRNVYRMEQRLILRAEQYSLLHFPKNVLVSQADIDYLKTKSLHPESLELHSNGILCSKNIKHKYVPNKIVFVGNMRTLQNQDAVLCFVQDIFPRILKQKPDTKFYIVGAQPPQSIQQLASENIFVTGFVEDIEDTICDACLAIAPVRVAAGIQNKVLVAMSCGIPVVMTSLISNAIPELRHEENCLIQDEPATLADACLRIMNHTDLRQQLAINGYEMVKQHYSWKDKIYGYVK